MVASLLFQKSFSPKLLKQCYIDKIQYRASIGMDNVTPKAFENDLDKNIRIISDNVTSGHYHFTRYREVLISKGRGKEPRVISIPTIRDKLALASYHSFLQNVFHDVVDEPLLHTIVGNITYHARSGQYSGFVKVDITKFYASINHTILLKKIRRKIRKKEALEFLTSAISNQTIPRNTKITERTQNLKGVPEGLSISNILADIYLSDLKSIVCNAYNVQFFRYVDDILILCDAQYATDIKDFVVTTLHNKFDLEANLQKTTSGKLSDGVTFLGYVFYDDKISIRPAAVHKLENSLEDLFRKRKKEIVSNPLFIWRLNMRIAGCILDSKKYGWLFYYSQMDDLTILFHLDWLILHLFKRFKLEETDGIKSFVRVYHEITKNVSQSTYLINTDMYSCDEKRSILMSIYNQKRISTLNDEVINDLFKETMFREVERLEHDIQNFS